MSDVMIGLEIHAELDTVSKLFCSCPTQGSDEPNTRTCPVCLGHPGAKPVANKKAIVYALKLAQALGCTIAPQVIFSRKSYFYPDLAKNYQITQYEEPLGAGGRMEDVRIRRVHMEEDPASLVHPKGMQDSSYVLVDYNRSGNPLVEIVTEPDITSPEQAREFMKTLLAVLQFLGIHDPKKNILKADANVSIRSKGFVRTEIKNITGFKEIERALQYEIQRQKREGAVFETRSWDSQRQITLALRKKESEEDYGYIFDPDLVPIDTWEEDIPQMPWQRYERYVKEGVGRQDARIIAYDYGLVKIFEEAKSISAPLAARWIRRDLQKVLNYTGKTVEDIDAHEFCTLLERLHQGKVTETSAQKILEHLPEGINVDDYIGEHGLEAVSDKDQLESWAQEVIEENPEVVEDYRQGSQKAINYLMGQVMRKSRGKADPREVRKILARMINAGDDSQ